MDEEKVTEQMTVLVVEPGYAPYEKTIPHELHAMQEIVRRPDYCYLSIRGTGRHCCKR